MLLAHGADTLGKTGEVFLIGEGKLRIRLERDVSQAREELRKRAREESR